MIHRRKPRRHIKYHDNSNDVDVYEKDLERCIIPTIKSSDERQKMSNNIVGKIFGVFQALQSRKIKSKKTKIRNVPVVMLLIVCSILVLVIAANEVYSYWLLNCLPNIDQLYLARPSDLAVSSTVVVSMHRGLKFYGYLGKWLQSTKQAYAARHSYAYFDYFLSTDHQQQQDLVKFGTTWHEQNAIYFDKLRVLLYIMDKYTNLQHILWIDGDAVIANPKTTLTNQIHKIQKETQYRGVQPFCLIWAEDTVGPNAGVLVLHNSPVTRQLLRDSLSFIPHDKTFADQAALKELIASNPTYRECTIVLTSKPKKTVVESNKVKEVNSRSLSTLLQSRVRGLQHILYRPGDWILHLPNHNRWELLQSLSKWLGGGGDNPKQQILKNSLDKQQSCQRKIEPLGPADLSRLSTKRRERYEAVRKAIQHAWKGYTHAVQRSYYSFPDDLNPVTGEATEDWLYHAATLHDSLDTLYLANLTDEYQYAIDWVVSTDLQTTSSALLKPTKTFEYSLRIIGGLLGAYSVSGDVQLLQLAMKSTDALLQGPFASSPTALPRPYDILAPPYYFENSSRSSPSILLHILRTALFWTISYFYRWGRDTFTREHHINSLAGLGSFGLEFEFLSDVTDQYRYRSASNAIYQILLQHSKGDGMIPNIWNVVTGTPTASSPTGLASGGDSFYEYLLKVPLWNGCAKKSIYMDATDACDPISKSMLQLYYNMLQKSLVQQHVYTTTFHGVSVLPVDGKHYHHLLCFLPGLLALQKGKNTTFKINNSFISPIQLAEQMVQGCHSTYTQTMTGLGFEQANIYKDQFATTRYTINDWGYYLRPEHIESLFVLYRQTHNPVYQDMAWTIFESIEQYCHTRFGYQGIRNVTQISSNNNGVEDMPSYFLAETLKYLLLLFGPDDYISLNEYVFTTEAHPLRRLLNNDVIIDQDQNCIISDISSNSQRTISIVWFRLSLEVCVIIAIIVLVLRRRVMKSRYNAQIERRRRRKTKIAIQ